MNDVTAKNASRVKLVGIGLGVSTNRFAFGCAARNDPSASGWPAPAAAAARCSSRNSSLVRTGKPLTEWATISVWTCSARWKRMPSPGGQIAQGRCRG